MTPSNASFSPICASRRFSQYSNTSLARTVISSSREICCSSSSSVKLSRAASVVAHMRRTAERSSSGGGLGPRRRGRRLRDVERAESSEVEERPWPSLFTLLTEDGTPVAVLKEEEGELPSRFIEGRTSFFCFEAGRISSRSTGTPRETRKTRRMRDFVQLAGWSGGGETSWDQSERERPVMNKAEESGKGSMGGRDERFAELGNRVSR